MKKILCICACMLCLCACNKDDNNKVNRHELVEIHSRVGYSFNTITGNYVVVHYDNVNKVVDKEWELTTNQCYVLYYKANGTPDVRSDLYEYSDSTYVIVDFRLTLW